jgi:alcohol dehydrogenase class IV
MADFEKAKALLREFKGDSYLHGVGVLPQVGSVTKEIGQRAILVSDSFSGSGSYVQTIKESLETTGVAVLEVIRGAAPNAPREDLARITQELIRLDADVILSFGGGSTIDATKAAEVLQTLGGEIEDYFGVGLVGQRLADSGEKLTPHVAIQTASSSAAHLTKYSNITDVSTGQKKLIVDEAIVPNQPIFDYEVTLGTPPALAADGALDGVSHCLEVLYDSVGKPHFGRVSDVATNGIELVVRYLPRVIENPQDIEAREALGLATDLGGYAIMLGGTNGAHLTSFSLVDILTHGRACAIMNPYYTVFFAPEVEEALLLVGRIFQEAGYTGADIENSRGRELGVAVAESMIAFERRIGFPTTLGEVPGFSDAHIERALVAAKNPQLRMKLENMPVSLTAESVDEFMGSVLLSAKAGDLNTIKNV